MFHSMSPSMRLHARRIQKHTRALHASQMMQSYLLGVERRNLGSR